MSETLDRPTPLARPLASLFNVGEGFYQKHVLNLLKGMTDGSITMTLPSGEKHQWGDPSSDVRATLHVRQDRFFKRCVLYGDIGFGESYVDGDWDTDDITALISWMILNIDRHPAMSGSRTKAALNLLRAVNWGLHALRPNDRSGSRKNIEDHYDLSNEFFKQFLDPTMTYSSAYFDTGTETLEEAQRAKVERLCQKLRLQPTDHVLEIGSGWGGFATYAASQYGCRVTTLTLSHQQLAYVRDLVKKRGLESRVEVRYQDYRDVTGSFDKIVSVEMLEAVGHEYLPAYFAKCHEVLKPNGILALQVILSPDSRYDQFRRGVDWIQKHIFPGSLLPSVKAINAAINKTGDLTLHSFESMGDHYVKTLGAWRQTFESRRSEILALGFKESFIRKWRYYFSYCEAAFAMRNISVAQMVYTRPNNRLL